MARILSPAPAGRDSNNSGGGGGGAASSSSSIAEAARYVPMRLSSEERSLLEVLEQTLRVSEYTDLVDVVSRRQGGEKTRRILEGILEVCHIATGLAAASGQERKFADLIRGGCSRATDGGQPLDANAALSNVDDDADNTKKKRRGGKKLSSGKKSKSKFMKSKKKNKGRHGEDQDLPVGGSWAGRKPSQNAVLFQTMFEVGRRNKVLNPSSMRTTYGKLMYLLQDAQNPTVARSLGFSLHKDLVLVGEFLEERDCTDLLYDPRLECAIQYVSDRDPTTGNRLDRAMVDAMVLGKQQKVQELAEAYGASVDAVNDNGRQGKISQDDVRRAIESLADAVAYVESNVRPVQTMLRYLEDNFDQHSHEKGFSLALTGTSRSYLNSPPRYSGSYGLSAYNTGSSEGPTLSHSHSTQWTFVWQSLRLWCKVQRNMHKLWVSADDDLLSTTSTYHLYNTGQGLNRVQNCPRVRKVMSNLLHQTQQEAGSAWVGLSVVHLGDRDVPNALIFIDKYTQIPRFLSPIVTFLQSIPELCSDERITTYVQAVFGTPEKLKLTVLADYFKHGFDGSGDDGGSCIDGRLTSSWNWTSRIAKKKYYQAFMLSGFQGFDGDFR